MGQIFLSYLFRRNQFLLQRSVLPNPSMTGKSPKQVLNTLSLLLQVSAATNKRKTPSDKRVVVGYGVTDAQARDREREGGSFLSFTTEAAF